MAETGPAYLEKVCQALPVNAFARFGRGRHPAALNFGDCLAQATAKSLGDALLFVGDDFSRTDVASP